MGEGSIGFCKDGGTLWTEWSVQNIEGYTSCEHQLVARVTIKSRVWRSCATSERTRMERYNF